MEAALAAVAVLAAAAVAGVAAIAAAIAAGPDPRRTGEPRSLPRPRLPANAPNGADLVAVVVTAVVTAADVAERAATVDAIADLVPTASAPVARPRLMRAVPVRVVTVVRRTEIGPAAVPAEANDPTSRPASLARSD